MKTKSSLGELETPSGELISDSQEKANILNKFFASVSEDEGSDDNLPDFENRPFTEPLYTCNTEITEELITKAIDKLKPTKAQGPDNIHPKLIKECKKVFDNSVEKNLC